MGGLRPRKPVSNKQKAVFLDRDGTINEYVGLLTNIDDFKLINGVADAIKDFHKKGYLVIVVTNQPVIARGEITIEELEAIHNKMETLLGMEGAYVDDILYCPHHPDSGFEGERPEYKIECSCRKPKPGMLLEAAERYNINLSCSYMIGDSKSDVIAGIAVGCKTILLENSMTLKDTITQVTGNIMKSSTEKYIDELIKRYPTLSSTVADILDAYETLRECYLHGGKLLVAGNGGSAADSEHIVGELMKGFVKKRPIDTVFAKKLVEADYKMGGELAEKLQEALPAMSLTVHNGLNTAISNDIDGLLYFAQGVNGYGKTDDVFLGISTSGNSKNILYETIVAKAKGMKIIGLTGKDGGKLKEFCDVAVIVNEQETYKIQELHLPIYHTLCLMLENEFFNK